MSSKNRTLSKIVSELRRNWPVLDEELVEKAIADLKGLEKVRDDAGVENPKYVYDINTFPPLSKKKRGNYSIDVGTEPTTLAEALIWNLGKWNSYLTFVDDYEDESTGHDDRDNAVVFYGFAKHMRKRSNPIFDQHAARALWAISKDLWGSQNVDQSLKGRSNYQGHFGDLFFHYLTRQNGNWKDVGDGRTTMACYSLYCRQIRAVCKKSGISHDTIDKLLMPLGQALKDRSERDKNGDKLKKGSSPYQEFLRIVGQRSPSLDAIRQRRKEALISQRKLAKAAKN